MHRDVKPGNLLVSDSDVVKLADFGIARAADQSSITQVGSVLGTAAYLAPEQARGDEAGPRADLYSLGVVTYQLISGRLPYEAASLSELALKQQRESPIPLDELVPEVPHALAQAVAMALSIDQRGPARRRHRARRGAARRRPGDRSSRRPGRQLRHQRRHPGQPTSDPTAATRCRPRPRPATARPGRPRAHPPEVRRPPSAPARRRPAPAAARRRPSGRPQRSVAAFAG